MKREVGIAELEANLSEYVQAASKGEEIVIKDRDTPIAMLTPIEPKWPPYVIPAKNPMHSLDELEGVTIPGLTPEEFDRIWEETRKDRLFEWATSKTST